jgi:hypothetical protein
LKAYSGAVSFYLIFLIIFVTIGFVIYANISAVAQSISVGSKFGGTIGVGRQAAMFFNV